MDGSRSSTLDLPSSTVNRLFLFRLPDFINPFLRFLLARTEFRVGVGERILDTRFASLVRRYFTEGNIVAQRRTVDVRHQRMRQCLSFFRKEPVHEEFGCAWMRRIRKYRYAAARSTCPHHAYLLG